MNVDVNGTVFNSTVGYTFVSESTGCDVITSTAPNGDTVTTFTTTKVWPKDVPVNLSDLGNRGILVSTLGDARAQGEAMHSDPNPIFY